MTVHAYVSHPHYWDHLQPIVAGLPVGLRGGVWAASDELARVLRLRGVAVWGPRDGRRMPAGEPVLVAGFADVRAVRGRPVGLVEHGAGQTYVKVSDGSYAGGRGRGRVSLFLCPSGRVADANRKAYPDATVEVVGCPRLDVLHKARREYAQHRDGTRVAVSFHWACGLVPEAGSGWDAFRGDVTALVADGRWQVLGHGHPRLWSRLERWWRRLGVEPVENWLSVIRRADVFVCDNSSTMFEACAVGLPVVVLNAPQYRRGVEHGLRFWEHAGMGPNVEPGDGLEWALNDVALFERERAEVAQAVYDVLPDGSGEATRRAVEAVVLWATR